MEEPEGNPWVIKSNGTELAPEVRYKGHTILNNRVTLKYELVYEGKTIKLEEQPEYYSLPDGRVGFERTFKTTDVPAGAAVGLKMHLNSIVAETDVHTDGKFDVDKKETEDIAGQSYQVIEGTLWLTGNDETTFSVDITPKPEEEQIAAEELGEEEAALALMENSDCSTCHNQDERAVGPSYRAVARRYQNTPENLKALTTKVIKGGAGNWGEVPMVPHTEMPEADAVAMVAHILSLDAREENQLKEIMPDTEHQFTFQRAHKSLSVAKAEKPGVAVNVYQLDYEVYGFPQLTDKMVPQASGVANMLHAYDGDLSRELKEFTRNYTVQASGYLHLKEDTHVEFRLASYFGSRLYIDDELVVETAGNLAVVKEGAIRLKAGKHPFRYEYFKRGGQQRLSLQWRPYGSKEYAVVPPEVFTHKASDVKKVTASPALVATKKQSSPGDGAPLEAVHPSFTLSQARPENFQPKVAGMDFMSDGRLVVSTWDSLGSVFMLEGVQGSNPEAMQVRRIASGLAEPLGLKVVDDEIYVLQKQELTKLVDLNDDGITDEYRTVCNSWTGTDNHHEFAFGLAYKDGYFYGALSVAIAGGGPSARYQAPDRGKAFKISKEDGAITYVANGLRTPNGIGMGIDDELFIADNQGDWLPANKIVHLQQGAFYGSRSVIDFDGKAKLTETLPVVYLEHDQIGNSPSQPAKLDVGPYKNQMIHGDVTIGGIQRVFAEKVDGAYQGAVFKFTQGLEAGVNRLVWGPDGALYVGGIGNGGNWGQHGKLRYGLQKLAFNNKPTFEMLAVRAKPNGIEIEFTEPLKAGTGTKASDYNVRQWWYKPTANYGGPNMDEEDLNIKKVTVSADRKKVLLELPDMAEKHVLYIRLNKGTLLSSSGKSLWTTEAWYTMNAIPGTVNTMSSN
jgi:cytochrome c